MVIFIPATKLQEKGQTWVLQEDARATSHDNDGISLIAFQQNFLKSSDYWKSFLSMVNSGQIYHQCRLFYNQILPFVVHGCEMKSSKNCYKNMKQLLALPVTHNWSNDTWTLQLHLLIYSKFIRVGETIAVKNVNLIYSCIKHGLNPWTNSNKCISMLDGHE